MRTQGRFSFFQGVATRHEGSYGKSVRNPAFGRKRRMQIHSVTPNACGLKPGLRTEAPVLNISLTSQLPTGRQTTFSRFERLESATLLFDQVILNASDRVGGLEDFEPWRVALAEKRAKALFFARASAPLLA